jgi:hypothetical protein
VLSRVRATGFAASVGVVYAAGSAATVDLAYLVWYGTLAACLAVRTATVSCVRS